MKTYNYIITMVESTLTLNNCIDTLKSDIIAFDYDDYVQNVTLNNRIAFKKIFSDYFPSIPLK